MLGADLFSPKSFCRAGMVERSESLASKFSASLRVPPFDNTQVHVAGGKKKDLDSRDFDKTEV